MSGWLTRTAQACAANQHRAERPWQSLRAHFHGPVIAAGGFDGNSAEAILQSGDADLVAFSRHFIANPDLRERLRKGLPLNAYDRATFFGGTAIGDTDYLFYEADVIAA